MSDMFGAPIGIGAAERDQVALTRGALEAQETLGKIAAQPAALEHTQAQTRLLKGQAGVLEAEAGDQSWMAAQVRTPGAAPGQVGTPGATAESQAASAMERFSTLPAKAMEAGRPKLALELMTKLGTMQQHEASARASDAAARVRDSNVRKETLKQIGGIANAALQMNDAELTEAWPGLAMRVAQMPGLPPGLVLPRSLPAIRRMLKFAADGAKSAHDQATEKETARLNDARIPELNSRIPVNTAKAKLLGTAETAAKRDLGEKVKNGGAYSEDAVKARKVNAELAAVKTQVLKERLELSKQAQTAAYLRQGIVPAPPPEQRKEGTVYLTQDGKPAQAVMNPATQQLGLVLVAPPPPRAAAGAGRPSPAVQNDTTLADNLALEDSGAVEGDE